MRAICIALLLCSSVLAQKQVAPSTIGWSQIPLSGFGVATRRPPRSQAAKERVAKLATEKQEKVFGPLVGRRFYGFCEVSGVRPASAPVPQDEAFTVTALECTDPLARRAGHSRISEDGVLRLAVRWKTSENEAMSLTKSQRFNVAGEIEKVVIADGIESRVIVLELKDATY